VQLRRLDHALRAVRAPRSEIVHQEQAPENLAVRADGVTVKLKVILQRSGAHDARGVRGEQLQEAEHLLGLVDAGVVQRVS
jgi:hypothetical protein